MTEAEPGRRVLVGALALVGGLLAFVATFLPWISTDTEDGGTTSITGWGGITGSSQIAGTNLNDVLNGSGTYRPGLVGLIFGVIAAVAGFVIMVYQPPGRRPHRITAAVLTVCGLVCLGFGGWRGLHPGDASVFDAGEASAGFGPWLTAIAGVLILAGAVLVFAGRLDPPVTSAARRGIQPR
ncbi:hypothetical protein [Nakamurella multipartita]|uniref:Uncharacterized protein n=1 Tax=Nakamurella multipartita (strain ATCC 700099 / DSM 44233 / CIP 104796 / JCM 9543 / NBRC 105858 / Y-104) TaxID=479431 RepID=C8XD15_NAKMY|nr:hypothetical protein [Nakamurella multipartita]ACV79618.1 hypothetical protein Namu_3288 [Nakamurella multipartita DSM 44233]